MSEFVPLWMQDTDGERWLENPQLIVANRPKGRTKMYTNPNLRKGSAQARSYMKWVRSHQGGGGRRKKSAKRNFFTAGTIANPPARRPRTYSGKKTGKYFSFRKNKPSAASAGQTRTLMGLPVPALEPLAGAVLGFVAPPIVHSFVGGFIPAAIMNNTIGRYIVRAAEVILPSMLVRKFLNTRIGNYMLIAGFAKIAVDAVAEFAPGVVPGLSGYMGWQPMLGEYTRRAAIAAAAAGNRQIPMSLPALSMGVPNRLQPNFRN